MPLFVKLILKTAVELSPTGLENSTTPMGYKFQFESLAMDSIAAVGNRRFVFTEGKEWLPQQAGSTVRYPMPEETYKLSTLELVEHKK